MFVRPQPGMSYRHTQTMQLVPSEGFEADPSDLDINRALACGDLVAAASPAEPAPAPLAKAAKAQSDASAS